MRTRCAVRPLSVMGAMTFGAFARTLAQSRRAVLCAVPATGGILRFHAVFRSKNPQLAHRHSGCFLLAHFDAGLFKETIQTVAPNAHSRMLGSLPLRFVNAAAMDLRAALSEAAQAVLLYLRAPFLIRARHADLHNDAFAEIALARISQCRRSLGIRSSLYVRRIKHRLGVFVQSAGIDHAIESVDGKLDRGVDIDPHVGNRLRGVRISANAHESGNQACGNCDENAHPTFSRHTASRRNRALPARDAIASARRKVALTLYAKHRRLFQLVGSVHVRKGFAHTLVDIVHDNASLSIFLPREIQEYTVPSGALTMRDISGTE